jgi:hypothetical protein
MSILNVRGIVFTSCNHSLKSLRKQPVVFLALNQKTRYSHFLFKLLNNARNRKIDKINEKTSVNFYSSNFAKQDCLLISLNIIARTRKRSVV